ncbi:MAG: GNAT family N-acetyltransferase [Chloroflexi bacterium]|nr:GNAT family N-acetyltransferase [Chloroflexota bacterium]MCI0577790.1 GNAT family N-acetyltransferase [Chloroflexota bacterium]MCI0643404.1 GNAT family N-acetyltransferase [Chloroflexota bacterium]MCI0731050.1 GNAT family N-acetyltransferase [Chloroflexota bacterium]
MEIANVATAVTRMATRGDAGQITRLFQVAAYTHTHADWHLPVDWLETPGFVVTERENRSGEQELLACLAATADPLPAAWVRLAALNDPSETLATMMAAVLSYLRALGVTELGWLAVEEWPDRWLPALGFSHQNWITTFVKYGHDLPPLPESRVTIRPATPADMPALATIEQEAFKPLWRHSAETLALAFQQSLSFDVAELDGRIAGFQYSARGQSRGSAHLVRITVTPAAQHAGVGSALMKTAIEGYQRHGVKRVSLNTQVDNLASHRLYQKFGFSRTGDQLPVWVLPLV